MKASNKRGTVSKIDKVRTEEPGLDYCLVRIGFNEYAIFYDFNDLAPFLNKEVLYSTRFDKVNGLVKEVITEIALVTEVVEVKGNVPNAALIPFNVERPVCNFNIKDIAFREYRAGCIGILVKADECSSSKANWFDCKVLDAYSHEFDLRIFLSKEDIQKTDMSRLIGQYIQFDIEMTQYGYQTKDITGLDQEVTASPEIAVAKLRVMEYLQTDQVMREFFNRKGLEGVFDGYVDTEPGYLWVRIASELEMLRFIENVTTGVDMQVARRATIITKLFALPHKQDWSDKMIIAFKVVSEKELMASEDMLYIVNDDPKQTSVTKQIYYTVKNTVDTIIKERRGVS